jgi:hypothetical protein
MTIQMKRVRHWRATLMLCCLARHSRSAAGGSIPLRQVALGHLKDV